MEKLEPCALLLGMQNSASAMETAGDASEINIEQYSPAVSPLGVYPKESQSGSPKDAGPPVAIAGLFTAGERREQPHVHQQMNKGRTWEAGFRSVLKSPAFRTKEPCHVQPKAQRTLAGP